METFIYDYIYNCACYHFAYTTALNISNRTNLYDTTILTAFHFSFTSESFVRLLARPHALALSRSAEGLLSNAR